jgi:MFS transporter, DHA1 family, multidrug resistance protein
MTVRQENVVGHVPVTMLLLLGGLSAVPPFSFDMYLSALPGITEDFGVPESQVQLTLSACLLGIAVGQLVGGPVSDARGRRRPLLLGLTGYTACSVLCALSPSVGVLIGVRFLQGLFGGMAVVLSRAVVRDRADGREAARIFSLLMTIGGIAPIVAPIAGGLLVHVTSWRVIFLILAGLGVVGLAATIAILPETLPPADRRAGGMRETLAVGARVLRDRTLVGYALTGAFSFGALFFWISSSSFVLQDIYGLSTSAFSAAFAANAILLMAAGRLNATLVRRRSPEKLLRWGVGQLVFGGVAMCSVLWLGFGLPAVLVTVSVAATSLPFIAPNSTALALAPYGREAGTVSAFLGVVQFAVGAVASPIAGTLGDTTAHSMAFGFVTMGVLAFLAHRLLVTRVPDHPHAVLEEVRAAFVEPLPD